MADGEEHAKFEAALDNHAAKGTQFGCVWKHASSIAQSKWKTHPCHYPTSGTKRVIVDRKVYEKDHLDRAVNLGYLQKEGNVFKIARRAALEEVNAKKAERKKQGNLRAGFLQDHTVRVTKPLEWLIQDAEGWHVQHQHP